MHIFLGKARLTVFYLLNNNRIVIVIENGIFTYAINSSKLTTLKEVAMEEITAAPGGGGTGQKPFIAFNSVAEYNTYAGLTEATREAFSTSYKAANTSFVSLQDYATNATYRTTTYSSNLANSNALVDSIDALPLQLILNTDGVVQIGNKIVYLKVANQTCYILDAAYDTEYADLIAGNTANSHITGFSFDDDVIGEIDASFKCGGSGASRQFRDFENPLHRGYTGNDQRLRNLKIKLNF